MAGKIQNEDVKSLSELTGAGGVASQLVNDTKIYVTASSINKQLSQAIIDGDIGGGSGGINYIPLSQSNGASASGWATYADAAGTSPVNGTGGSPSSTFATSTNSSLVGTANYLWTKSAANRQGEGFSYDFSIDAGYQSKPFSISFLYSVASGTYVDGDMTVWIYDVTNSVLIQPTAYSILNVTGVGVQKCEFQAASNSTSYRLIVHTSSTSASAYSLRFDSFSVSPNTYNVGAVVTQWQSYAPTTGGLGTPTNNNAFYRRVGDSLQVYGSLTVGTTAASTCTISLPTGLSIDSVKLPSNASGTFLGSATRFVNASSPVCGSGNGLVIFYDGSTTGTVFVSKNLASFAYTKDNGSAIFSSSDTFTYQFTVPIAGWGTTQVLSSDTDTRVVAAKATYIGANINYSSANTALVYNTVAYDTTGSYNSGTGIYTVSTPGKYLVSVHFIQSAAGGGIVYISKNGNTSPTAAEYILNSTTAAISGFNTIDVVAGDTISVRMNATSSNFFPGGVTITRISGPAQIAASENVRASYYDSSVTKTPGTDTQYNFDTKVYDTHGAVTTGSSWKFTAPVSGNYQISAHAYWNSGGGGGALQLFKNGSVLRYLSNIYGNTAGTNIFAVGSTTVYLFAGDYIDVRPSSGATFTGGAVQTHVDIFRQGN